MTSNSREAWLQSFCAKYDQYLREGPLTDDQWDRLREVWRHSEGYRHHFPQPLVVRLVLVELLGVDPDDLT